MEQNNNSKKNYFTRTVLPIIGGLAVGAAVTFGAMKYHQKDVDAYNPSVELGHTINAPLISSPVNQLYVDKTSNVVVTGTFTVGNNSGNAKQANPAVSSINISSKSLDVVVNDSLVTVRK